MSLPAVGRVLVLAVLALVWPAVAAAQRLVIVVRHAERADGGSMSKQAQTDPLLSDAGAARAARLTQALRESGVTAVYATEFKRTQDTVRPLATALGLSVTPMPAKDTAALVARIKAEQGNGIVLIAGHSNTVPDVVKAFGGPTFTMGDDEYGDLFIVVPGTGTMTKVKF